MLTKFLNIFINICLSQVITCYTEESIIISLGIKIYLMLRWMLEKKENVINAE
jgi:hypothetical protein